MAAQEANDQRPSRTDLEVLAARLAERRGDIISAWKVEGDGDDSAERSFEQILAAIRRAWSEVAEAAQRPTGGRPDATGERSADERRLLESIRRGEVDAVLGSGPRAGEVLVVKALALEEENRRLVDELRREKEGLQDFSFATAHDLGGPLGNIESEIASLLDRQERVRLPLWFVDSLRQIEHAAFRMRVLVSDLLLLGEAGSEAEPVETIELFDLVASVLDGYRARLARSRIRVEIVDELPRVVGRVRHFETVFDNLIDNAVRYASKVQKGQVQIGCAESGQELVIWVRDNGPGFDPREAEVVFEPYIRLDKASGGTGLGLTIVRKAVASHGGRAWIETATGLGTTAFVALPIASAEQLRARSDLVHDA